jgi:hypothetical protein
MKAVGGMDAVKSNAMTFGDVLCYFVVPRFYVTESIKDTRMKKVPLNVNKQVF